MQRVMVVGGPGSGKSTLAVKLGKLTGLPVYHMDHIHYEAGWVERKSQVKSAMTNEIHARDAWIFEGGHSATYQQRLARADTFIWLDMPLWLRLYRVLHRTFRYLGTGRPDLPAGCPERLNFATVKFLGFIWRTRKTSRQRLADIYENPPSHLQALRFGSRAAVENYLQKLAVK